MEIVGDTFGDDANDHDEEQVRLEKPRALGFLDGSRVAVLAGPVGTGKTLVIGLLLDATGKAPRSHAGLFWP
jgi:type II secretory pathway predicted ATPase ExeA